VVKRIPGTHVGIHAHNDTEQAVANSLAAVRAGARQIQGTLNGLGERSGNAATEEVAMALEVLYGIPTGLDLTKLTTVSQTVAELSGIRTQVNKAVVGDSAFRHESGMVVAGLLQDPFTAEVYEPELVGQKRQILLGKKSGLVSIAYKVKELALPMPEQSFPEMLNRVKQASVSKHRALTDDEFKAIANDLMA